MSTLLTPSLFGVLRLRTGDPLIYDSGKSRAVGGTTGECGVSLSGRREVIWTEGKNPSNALTLHRSPWLVFTTRKVVHPGRCRIKRGRRSTYVL